MDANIFKVSAVCAALFLAGCSEQETAVDTSDTTPPAMTVSNLSPSLNEGGTIEIPFNVIDQITKYEDLSVKLDAANSKGDVVLDLDKKVIVYSAPWLTEDKSLIDGFSIWATDQAGNKSEELSISVDVQDIDSAVSVEIVAPTQAFGYKNTETLTSLNMWMYEGQSQVRFKYNIEENDADSLSIDFEASEPFFKNNFVAEMGEDEGSFTLISDIPVIDEPYADTLLQVIVEDNDDAVQLNANIVIINKVDMNWVASSDTSISESKGATFKFAHSESEDYDAETSVLVTYTDGSPIDFPLEYALQGNNIVFEPSDGFQGDRRVKLTVAMSNTIPGNGGEEFKERVEISRTLVVSDDRDDDFISKEAEFKEYVEHFEDLKDRKEDVRVAKVLAKYWMLNDYVTYMEKNAIISNVEQLFSQEIVDTENKITAINSKIDAGQSAEELTSLINDFVSSVKSIGSSVRKEVSEKFDAIASVSDVSDHLAPSVFTESTLINGRLTQYAGNLNYGYYDKSSGDSWVFSKKYAYLKSVDVLDEFCI